MMKILNLCTVRYGDVRYSTSGEPDQKIVVTYDYGPVEILTDN